MKNRTSEHQRSIAPRFPLADSAGERDEPPPSGPSIPAIDGAVSSLLDTLQTSESRDAGNPLKRRETRKKASDALANKVHQFDPRRGQRMRECGAVLHRDVCKGCGTEKFRLVRRCMDRFCPSCASKRSGELAERYAGRVNKVMTGRYGYHLVLTVKNTKELPDYTLFIALMKRMRKHEFWERFGGIIGGLYSVEVTKKRGGTWHPHFHVLMFTREPLPVLPDGQWTIAFNQAVSDVWRELTGGESYIVRGEQYDGRAVEMVKYLAKPSDVAAMAVDDIEALFRWTRGKRMVQTFGELFGVADEEQAERGPCGCEACGGTSFERTVMHFDRKHRRYVAVDVFDVEADVQDEADEQSTGPP